MYTSYFGKPLALSQICCHGELPWSLPDPLRLTALGSPSSSLLSFRVILVSKMAFAFFFSSVSHSSNSVSGISKRRKNRHHYFFYNFKKISLKKREKFDKHTEARRSEELVPFFKIHIFVILHSFILQAPGDWLV